MVRKNRRRNCRLTLRSSGAPTAGHQARSGGTRVIFASPGLASCRCRPLSSNVRRQKTGMARIARILGSASRSEETRRCGCAPPKCSSGAPFPHLTASRSQAGHFRQLVPRAAAVRRLPSGLHRRRFCESSASLLGARLPARSVHCTGASPLPPSTKCSYCPPRQSRARGRSQESSQKLPPNPSFKRSANGRPRRPSSAGASPHFALAVRRVLPSSP